LIGCNSGEDDPTQTLDPNHTSVAVLTEKDFILNGSTDYKVVLPEDNTEYENVAAGELINFMYEATGVKLSLINENASIIATDSSKYVFIGQTQANKELNQDFSDTALTQDGFKIITKNNNYHLLGGTRFGNVYACYELMYHLIGWEIYAENEIVYNQGSTVKFKEITANEIPDFEFACPVEFETGAIVPRSGDNTYAVNFRYFCVNNNGQIAPKDYTIVLKLDMGEGATMKWTDRLNNPLGIRVSEYTVESVDGNANDKTDPLDRFQ
jgi:hypothetical protein